MTKFNEFVYKFIEKIVSTFGETEDKNVHMSVKETIDRFSMIDNALFGSSKNEGN